MFVFIEDQPLVSFNAYLGNNVASSGKKFNDVAITPFWTTFRFRYAQDPNSVTPSCASHLGPQSQVPFANFPRIEADYRINGGFNGDGGGINKFRLCRYIN
jgi:hypothetical protein